MIYLYGQNVAVCGLAVSLIIAGIIAWRLPKECDLTGSEPTHDKLLDNAKRA
ncbi:hypothetical protein D3C78_1960340 [compost metagenome]